MGGEIGEAPPVADEASRFRGSAPIGGHNSARQSVGTTVGKRAPPLRTVRYTSVGADASVRPPTTHRTPCNVSLRSQCAHWLWQSASPVPSAPLPKGGWHGEAVTGGFFPRTSCNAFVGAGFSCPPSCQPIPGHCRVRQSGHFLETGSLHLPLAALCRFPRRPELGLYRIPCNVSLRGRSAPVAIRTPVLLGLL